MFGLSSQGQAALLPPGSGPTAPDVFASETGTLLATQTGSFSYGSGLTAISGNYREQVYREASGTLNFVYQFSATSGTGEVTRFTVTNFAGFTTDVGYLTSTPSGFSAGTAIPATVDRSPSGATVGFNFSPSVTAGTTTVPLIVVTDATNFTASNVNFIDGGVSSQPGFGPAPSVPEPASFMLLAGMMMGGAGLAYRRRKPHAIS